MRKKKFFNSAFWEGFASINLFGAPEKPLKKKSNEPFVEVGKYFAEVGKYITEAMERFPQLPEKKENR